MFYPDWLILRILHQSFEIERPKGHWSEVVVHQYIYIYIYIYLYLYIYIYIYIYIYVVYVMKCRGCGDEYIGETGNFLRRRVTVHNQQIRDPNTRILFISEHVSICAQQMSPKYHIFPFYKMYSDSTSLRRAKEHYFIKLLKPKLNRVT